VKFHTASAARRRAVASTEQAGGPLRRVASSHGMICPFNPRTSPIGGSALWRSILRDPSLNLRLNDSVLGVRRRQKPNLDCRECLVAPNADILNRLLYSPIGRREYTYRAARRKRRGNARFESRRCRDWPARLRCGRRKFPRSLSSYRKDMEIDRKRLPALPHATRPSTTRRIWNSAIRRCLRRMESVAASCFIEGERRLRANMRRIRRFWCKRLKQGIFAAKSSFAVAADVEHG